MVEIWIMLLLYEWLIPIFYYKQWSFTKDVTSPNMKKIHVLEKEQDLKQNGGNIEMDQLEFSSSYLFL